MRVLCYKLTNEIKALIERDYNESNVSFIDIDVIANIAFDKNDLALVSSMDSCLLDTVCALRCAGADVAVLFDSQGPSFKGLVPSLLALGVSKFIHMPVENAKESSELAVTLQGSQGASEVFSDKQEPISGSANSSPLPEGFIALGHVDGVLPQNTVATVQDVVARRPRVVLVSTTKMIKDLRREKSLVSVPIVVVGDEDPSLCYLAGADEYVPILDSKSVDLILARASRMRVMWAEAEVDALTGCYTRRFLNTYLNENHPSCSVLMCDLDHFKQVNDTYGHQAGDQVLRQFGQILRDNVRQTDIVVRYGGEEFVVIFQINTELLQAIPTIIGIAEDLCAKWAREEIVLPDGRVIHSTFSGGLATMGADGDTAAAVIELADRRLYEAKRGGRNRVVVSDVQKLSVADGPVPTELSDEEDSEAQGNDQDSSDADATPEPAPLTLSAKPGVGTLFRKRATLLSVDTIIPEIYNSVTVVWNLDSYKKADTCIEIAARLASSSREVIVLCEFDFTNPVLDEVFRVPQVDPSKINNIKPDKIGAGLLTVGNELRPEHVFRLLRRVKIRNVLYLPAGNDLGVLEPSRRYSATSVYKQLIDLLRTKYRTVIIDAEVHKDTATTNAAFGVADAVVIPVPGERVLSKYDGIKKVLDRVFFVTG